LYAPTASASSTGSPGRGSARRISTSIRRSIRSSTRECVSSTCAGTAASPAMNVSTPSRWRRRSGSWPCGECKPADKPGSVLDRAADEGRSYIWDAGYPAPRAAHLRHAKRATPERRSARSLFGLAPGGVYLAGRSPGRRWALTPPFHRCPGRVRGCVFSVALSFGSPRLGVTQRPALRSPDFPRTACARDRLAGLPAESILLAADRWHRAEGG